MAIADVVIHVAQELDNDARQDLEEALRHVKGVIAPRFGARAPHLLLVAYAPGSTSATDVLTYVAAQGYRARLVGM